METDVRGSRGPALVLIVVDQPVLAEVVRLALNHGHFTAQFARTEEEAVASLDAWRPHLAIVDADIGNGVILERLQTQSASPDRIPVVALTRRGDLQTKLAAFERG